MLVVDFPQLQAAIDHMSDFGRDVTECLEDIDQTMANLRASWDGSGSDAQAQAQQRWELGAEQMKAALVQLQKVVEAANKNYSDALEKNSDMWSSR